MVIPTLNFFDDELTLSMEIMQEYAIRVVVASTEGGVCRGGSGMIVQPDKIIKNVSSSHYHGVVILGGSGSASLWDKPALLSLIKEAHSNGNVVGGIDYGVGVLAKSGILDGKKATTSPSPEALEALSSNGGLYVNKPVVVDENIVTAEGPNAILDFMTRFLELLGVELYSI